MYLEMKYKEIKIELYCIILTFPQCWMRTVLFRPYTKVEKNECFPICDHKTSSYDMHYISVAINQQLVTAVWVFYAFEWPTSNINFCFCLSSGFVFMKATYSLCYLPINKQQFIFSTRIPESKGLTKLGRRICEAFVEKLHFNLLSTWKRSKCLRNASNIF